MSTQLSPDTLAYLEERHVATIVTLNHDGSPHVAPVWYEYEDGQLRIITAASAVKVKNIRRDPRVSVCIANDTSPAKYVLFEGTAVISPDGIEQATYNMYIRYEGEERGRQDAKASIEGWESTIITIEPNKIVTWVSDVED